MTAGTAKDAASAFFDELEQRQYEPLLKKARGKVRFDLVDGTRIEARYLTIDRGKIKLSKSRAPADGVLRVGRSVFEQLATGEMNVVAAVLRGEVVVEGDWRLLILVQRLFPAAPGAVGPRRHAGWAKRRT